MSPGSTLYVGAVEDCPFSVAVGVAAYKSDLVVCLFGVHAQPCYRLNVQIRKYQTHPFA